MEPIRTTELALQFAAPWSPGWLLVLGPLITALVVRLYRGQGRELPRRHVLSLVALRVLLFLLLTFLAFRPSLLWRQILIFPGRIVLLLDNSESMAVNDTGLTDTDALRQARLLHRSVSGAPQPAHDLAVLTGFIEEQIRAFQRFAESADRTSDTFWVEAERASVEVSSRFDEWEQQARTVTGLEPAERAAFNDLLVLLGELRSGARAFFTGDRNPPARAYETYVRKLREFRERLYQFQAALDRRALAEPNDPLHAVLQDMRSQSRLALLSAGLDGLGVFAREHLPGFAVQSLQLISGNVELLAQSNLSSVPAVPGVTDLLPPIERLLLEESPFPLAAIVLLSDGRNLGEGKPSATARLASQKQVPIETAGVGAAREPWDLAVLEVTAPPFGVKGSAANIRIRLKTVLPEPIDVRVSILRGSETVATESFRVGEMAEQTCAVRLLPAETGRFRYTVQVATAPSEIIPARNNRRDFVMNVREDKVRVLLLDWKPRWETRFLLNILQRLDYLDLNSLIVITGEEASLSRGVRKGTWPKDRPTLALYDLIVLGNLPADLLSAEEWAAVRDAVEKEGKTLCFLGGEAAARPPDPALLEALWPVDPAPIPAASPTPTDGSWDRFGLTEVGRLHPLTGAMSSALSITGESGVPGLKPGTRVLALTEPGGRAVITTRFVGEGKVLLVDHDQLWKRLNPNLLTGHAALYVNLVSWAVDGDRLTAGSADQPLLDRHVLSTRENIQVWLPQGATNDVIAAEVDGEVVARQPAVQSRPEAGEVYAVFEGLPAKDIRFRPPGGASGSPLIVVDQNPELGFLSRDDAFLASLAEGSGGQAGDFTELRRMLREIGPRERVEKQERVWRLWDARSVFTVLVLMLTAEWIWRKWVGLV